ncbi:hypothetical protein BC833DRAFT_607988 [Globomyces pollinis-pini]|nr:hypothetical protein BC833DRAFT_607988 [Globomyces pollinis-pini]
MGSAISRIRNAITPITTTQPDTDDTMRATGTYFGPNFVLDSTTGTNTTPAFWEDIMSVIASGRDAIDITEVYSQLPPAEIKTAITLQSKLNLQKSTIRLTNKKEAQTNNYSLNFQFDATEPCMVNIYWGCREEFENKGKLSTGYRLVDKNGNECSPIEFGPFEGLNQSFTLPVEQSILDNANLDGILRSAPMDVESPIESPTSPTEVSEIIKAIPETVMVNMDGTLEDQVKVDHNKIYHLVIVLEAINPKDNNQIEKTITYSLNSQATFVAFGKANHDQYDIISTKQLLLIDGMSFVLQEIFGFSETEDERNVNQISMKECVVCMSETKDTLVLPCRHLCLCNACANVLRMQGRQPQTGTGQQNRQGPPKCPICRQVFHSLIQISLPAPFNLRESRTSRSRLSLVPKSNDTIAVGGARTSVS